MQNARTANAVPQIAAIERSFAEKANRVALSRVEAQAQEEKLHLAATSVASYCRGELPVWNGRGDVALASMGPTTAMIEHRMDSGFANAVLLNPFLATFDCRPLLYRRANRRC